MFVVNKSNHERRKTSKEIRGTRLNIFAYFASLRFLKMLFGALEMPLQSFEK